MNMRSSRTYMVALIGAAAVVSMQCAKSSPSSPSSEGSAPLSSSNALGDATTSTPEAGIVKICKVGNVDGTFTITAVTGTPSVLSPVTVAHGACRIVAQNGTIPAPVTQSASFTETSAGLQSATIERCQNTTVGGACTSTGSSAFTNGGTVQFISNGDEKTGATITFTNNVTPPAQLSVVKTPDNGTFVQGAQVSFSIVVRNPAAAGAQSAVNVQLTDTLPVNGGLVWTTATTTQGSCTLTSNALSCSLGTIAPQAQVTVTVTSGATTPAAACQSQPNPAANATANGGLSATDSGSLSCTPPPPTGVAHGCTPGFWKNHDTTPPWAGYSPSQTVGSVFNIPAGIPSRTTFQSETLLDALNGGGGKGLDGKTTILLRAAVAALLNAYNGNPVYPINVAAVISQTNAALGSLDETTITNLATQLDTWNNRCDAGNQ